MKFYQYSLRMLIVIGSLGGFFGGWALVAHAGKPVASPSQSVDVAPAPLPTLPPLDFTGDNSSAGLQALPPMPQFSQAALPRLHTRGS